jgi:hypothetical protein
VCSLEWVGDGKRAQPCMVIWAANSVFGGMWCIGRRALTEFVGFDSNGKCTGSASEHCVREALASMPILGKDPNDKQALMALVDVVVRFAPDLVHMPVVPPEVRRELDNEAMFDVTLTNKNTGKVMVEKAV